MVYQRGTKWKQYGTHEKPKSPSGHRCAASMPLVTKFWLFYIIESWLYQNILFCPNILLCENIALCLEQVAAGEKQGTQLQQ